MIGVDAPDSTTARQGRPFARIATSAQQRGSRAFTDDFSGGPDQSCRWPCTPRRRLILSSLQTEGNPDPELDKPSSGVPATASPSVDATRQRRSLPRSRPREIAGRDTYPPRVSCPTDDRPESRRRQILRARGTVSPSSINWPPAPVTNRGTGSSRAPIIRARLARDAISNRLRVAQFKATFDLARVSEQRYCPHSATARGACSRDSSRAA